MGIARLAMVFSVTVTLAGAGCAGMSRAEPPPLVPPGPRLAPFAPATAGPARKALVDAARAPLDAYFAARLRDVGATGLSVGVVVDGELVYARGFGVRDVEGGAPVDADTVFRIASMTKSFTALAILKLRDEGRVALDAPAVTYLPELAALRPPTTDAPPITVRMLLTHGSGLAWDDLWGAETFGIDDSQLDRLIQSGLSFGRAPDTGYAYSNLGYALLGRIVARVTGRSFREHVSAEILRPLGMTSTEWDSLDVPRARMAVGYDRRPDGALVPEPRPSSGVFDAAGGLYTSLRDFARYAAFNLAAYPPRDGEESGPVRRSTLREMHQGQRPTRQGDVDAPIARRTDDGISMFVGSYGFGWHNVTSCTDDARVQHGGGEPGYFSTVSLFPAHGVALILMATTAPIGSLVPGAVAILRDAGVLPSSPPAPPPAPELVAAAATINGLVDRWDQATVERIFDRPSLRYSWHARLRDDMAALARDHGQCHPDGALQVHGRMHASWHLACARGAVTFEAFLTPSSPPALQTVQWREEWRADERSQATAARLASSIARWDDDGARALFAATIVQARIKKAFAHLAIDHGACFAEAGVRRIEHGVLRDPRPRAVFPLRCSGGPLELSFVADETSGQVTEIDAHAPRAAYATCWY